MNTLPDKSRNALAAVLFLLVAGCGGGGGGGGGSSGGASTGSVQPRYAYVANDADGTVSIFSVQATTGRLRHHGYVAGLGNNPRALAATPDGRFLFVGMAGSPNRILTLPADPATGLLGAVVSNVGSIGATGMVVDPAGKFLYAVDGGNVGAYAIDPATGALSAVAGSPYSAGTAPATIVMAANGRFLYVANSSSDDISQYAIDGTTGVLTPLGTIAAGSMPWRVATDPAGKFLYVANSNSSDISAYRISATTGQLTAIDADGTTGGIQHFPAGGTIPGSLAVAPDGKRLYVGNIGSDDISVFDINGGSGVLTAVAGSPFAAGVALYGMNLDPGGQYLYTSDSSGNTATTFTVNPATGAVTRSSQVAARRSPYTMAITGGATAATYRPRFAYVTNNVPGNPGTVTQFTIGTSGALSATGSIAAGTRPQSVAADPAGRFVYVANYTSNDVSAYAVDATTGALTAVTGSPFAAGTSPTAVRVDPAGRFLYVSNYGWPFSGSVSVYTINAATGALTEIGGSPFAAGNGSSSLAVDPAGRFVYVTNLLNDTVTAFAVNPVTGALTRLDADAGTAGTQDLTVANARPVAITSDASGRFVYLATACGTTWSFSVHATSGLLTRLDNDAGGLCGASASAPDSLAADPWGRYLYQTPYNSGSMLLAQAINNTNGGLSAITGSPFAAGSAAYAVTVEGSGQYAYAPNALASGEIRQYLIGSDGGLSAMSTPSAAAGSYPLSITTTGKWE